MYRLTQLIYAKFRCLARRKRKYRHAAPTNDRKNSNFFSGLCFNIALINLSCLFYEKNRPSYACLSVNGQLHNTDKRNNLRKLDKERRIEEILEVTEQQNIHLNVDDVSGLLQGCVRRKDLKSGRRIQTLMLQYGYDSIPVFYERLIRLFASCGCLEEGNQVFNEMPEPDVSTWGSILSAHVNILKRIATLELYYEMLQNGIACDKYVYLAIIKVCTLTLALDQGRMVHHHIICNGLQCDIFLVSSLIDMYAKCGCLESAIKLFRSSKNKDVVLWNTMIAGFSYNGEDGLAFGLFEEMTHEGIKPSKVTFFCILKSCGSNADMQQGRYFHDQIIENGLHHDGKMANAIVDMYVKCGNFQEAENAFCKLTTRNIITWGSMIDGYSQHGESLLAMAWFDKMEQEGIEPDRVIFLSIMKACSNIKAIEQGRYLHSQLVMGDCQLEPVLGNTLIDMYAKCGNMDEACKVFGKLPDPDIVSWTAMIDGYAQSNEGFLALEYFWRMQNEGIKPDKITFLSTSKAAGCIGAILQARYLHNEVIKGSLKVDAILGSTLINMYLDCGSLLEAHEVFDRLLNRDVASWNTMIAGYGQHGYVALAMQYFEVMHRNGIRPNDVTFLGILDGCNHAGLVDEGLWHFRLMSECYGVAPNALHYNCMVNLLGRAGCFEEAWKILQSTREHNIISWMALLNACTMYKNVVLGGYCYTKIVDLDYGSTAGHMLISKIYANAQMD